MICLDSAAGLRRDGSIQPQNRKRNECDELHFLALGSKFTLSQRLPKAHFLRKRGEALTVPPIGIRKSEASRFWLPSRISAWQDPAQIPECGAGLWHKSPTRFHSPNRCSSAMAVAGDSTPYSLPRSVRVPSELKRTELSSALEFLEGQGYQA